MITEREKKPKGSKLTDAAKYHMEKGENVPDRAKKHFRHRPYGMKGESNGNGF